MKHFKLQKVFDTLNAPPFPSSTINHSSIQQRPQLHYFIGDEQILSVSPSI